MNPLICHTLEPEVENVGHGIEIWRKTEPRRYQVEAYREAMAALLETGGFGLLLDMGTGKTKISIDLAFNLYKDSKIDAVIVIAPNGIHAQWIEEQLPEHAPGPATARIWKATGSQREAKEWHEFIKPDNRRLRWLAVNVERFSVDGEWRERIGKFMAAFRCLVIVDEATRIKTPDAKRTKNILEIGKIAPYRLILTGTPITNSPFDAFSLFEFLRPGFWEMSFFVFKAKFGLFVRDTNRGSGKRFNRAMAPKDFRMIRWYLEKGEDVETIAARLSCSESDVRYIAARPGLAQPYKNLDELRDKIRRLSIVIKKSEALDLPEQTYTIVHVPMSDTQRRLYQDLAKELIARLGDDELTVKNAAVLDMRLGQITGGFFPFDEGSPSIKMIGDKNPKVERLKDLLEEIAGQVIIWARFVAEIEILLSELRKAYPEKEIAGYYGAIPEKTREATKKAFQAGEIDYLVMNPQVGGMGLNFQNCATSIYYSRSYNLEERLQSEARIHRFGQSRPVQYIDLICPGTVEDKIVRALHAKKDLLEFFREKKIKEII